MTRTLRAGLVLALMLAALPLLADQLFPATSTPKVAADNDTGAVELGVKFTASSAGRVIAIRFYKGAGNSGTHVGNLWSSSGAKLATVTFTGETANGWQQAILAPPLQVSAGSYTASYFAPQGRYAVDNPYAFPRTAGALTAVAGVFKYGASSFPSSSFGTSNYWVDVVFEASGTTPAPPVPQPPTTPATGTASLSWSAPTQNTDGTALTDLAGYIAYHGLTASSLLDKVQVLVPAVAYTFTGLPAGTNYFAVSAYNAAGVESALSAVGSKVIAAPPAPPVPVDCIVSAWSAWAPGPAGFETRTRTVVTAPANAGVSCPVLTEQRAAAPPPDPCVTDPLVLSNLAWPTAQSGRRSIGYNTGTKLASKVEFIWPDALKVTDVRGCVATAER